MNVAPSSTSPVLRKDRLLKKDIEAIVRVVKPYRPCLGIPSKGIATLKHVFNHLDKTVNDAGAKSISKIEEKNSG